MQEIPAINQKTVVPNFQIMIATTLWLFSVFKTEANTQENDIYCNQDHTKVSKYEYNNYGMFAV